MATIACLTVAYKYSVHVHMEKKYINKIEFKEDRDQWPSSMTFNNKKEGFVSTVQQSGHCWKVILGNGS